MKVIRFQIKAMFNDENDVLFLLLCKTMRRHLTVMGTHQTTLFNFVSMVVFTKLDICFEV